MFAANIYFLLFQILQGLHINRGRTIPRASNCTPKKLGQFLVNPDGMNSRCEYIAWYWPVFQVSGSFCNLPKNKH